MWGVGGDEEEEEEDGIMKSVEYICGLIGGEVEDGVLVDRMVVGDSVRGVLSLCLLGL